MDICTVVTRNYIASARALAESHAAFHPESRRTVLVLDDDDGLIDQSREPFDVIRPGDLEIDDFPRRAGLYSALELSCAMKPALLTHLIDQADALAFIDSDIKLYGSLAGIADSTKASGIGLSPHSLRPLPNDGLTGDQGVILASGPFNAGFVSVSAGEEPRSFLRLWDDWVRTECFLDTAVGRCLDQNWLGLVPTFFEGYFVDRDPGSNVAYWNLCERSLQRSAENWLVNELPLRYFHFSGFSPENPEKLSRMDNRLTKTTGPLKELLDEYAACLMRHGWEEAQHWGYGLDSLPDGAPLDAKARSRYRLALQRGEMDADPFTDAGARQLAQLLDQDAEAQRAAAEKPALPGRARMALGLLLGR